MDLRSRIRSGYNSIKKEEKMGANVKGKSEMIVEYVIRDKDGNIKEQGVEGANGNIDE